MSLSSVHIVVNPTSGGGRAARRSETLIGALRDRGITATLHHTTAPGHATELAHMLATTGTTAVVAAGGDGTVHDVANGILRAGTATALGVIPLGTGNDFAKVVPGARTTAGALDVIARATPRRYDVGRARWSGGDEFFINGMGSGIDVEVVRQIERLPALPGAVKYLLGLLRALAVYRPIRLHAQVDSERLERAVMLMGVGNGICQGGGFYLTPAADPADGRLELCVIDALPLWQVPIVLARVLRGTHTGHPAVTMRGAERIRFEAAAAPFYFQLDGELRASADATWLEIEVQKGALSVLTGTEPDTE